MKNCIFKISFLLALLFILFAPTPANTQPVPTERDPNTATGDWIGSMSDGQLIIFFQVTGNATTGYTAVWNSLTQNVFGLKCRSVIVNNDSLTIETSGIRAFYHAKFTTPDSLTGQWQQNGAFTALSLKRTRRPQTPVPPYSYHSDSVEYNNTAGTVHLGATLTTPAKGSKFPVAILITGSGPQDRDETIFDHRAFAVIADYLTQQGLAILRVDDRGKGKSTGDRANPTSSDFADDVLNSIQYLRTRKEIDTSRIGLIGHSEGGLIAPIAYTRWPHLKFIIMLAGPGVPGWKILLRQQTDPVLTVLGRPAFDAWLPLIKEKLAIFNDTTGLPDSVILRQLKEIYTRWKTTLPDSLDILLRTKNLSPEMYAAAERAELQPWIRYFSRTDPAIFLHQVKCPVLALNGAKDTQVDPDQNIPAIRTALAKSPIPVTTIIFPGLNHLFQHCTTGALPEYAAIEETFAPEVLAAMRDWLRKISIL